MYHPGALAFSTSGGVPKIGQLLNAAWNLSDTCRYYYYYYYYFFFFNNLSLNNFALSWAITDFTIEVYIVLFASWVYVQILEMFYYYCCYYC